VSLEFSAVYAPFSKLINQSPTKGQIQSQERHTFFGYFAPIRIKYLAKYLEFKQFEVFNYKNKIKITRTSTYNQVQSLYKKIIKTL
ncbi:MAG: hypothetical protein ACI956_001688, partial [Nonlabens sp.]